MAPVWVCGILACGLVWWLNSSVVPWSVVQSRTLEDRLLFRKRSAVTHGGPSGAIANVAFDEPSGHRMWFSIGSAKRISMGTG